MATISTPLTDILGIRHPIVLAGMNVASGPTLAAAVSNAGGLGVIGGHMMTADTLKESVADLKAELTDPKLPFGIDILLPAVGEGARKTNYDYTKGQLPALVDVVCESGAKLFVSAVGVPPAWAVDRMHAAGILVMNMIGAPKHVAKALAVGVDIICAQGGEGGGHTGDVATSILIPLVVDLCRDRTSPLTGGPVQVLAAGGIFDGRGLAMSLALGASGVWVGTRFLASVEADAPRPHKEGVLSAGVHDTMRSLVFTGRPLRIKKNPYVVDWEENRLPEMKACLGRGELPFKADEHKMKTLSGAEMERVTPLLMGQVAGAIRSLEPAKVIVAQMMDEAARVLRANAARVTLPSSRL